LKAATDKQRDRLCHLLVQKEPFDLSALASVADYEGALERALPIMPTRFSVEARQNLIRLSDSPYSQALEQITFFLDDPLAQCRC